MRSIGKKNWPGRPKPKTYERGVRLRMNKDIQQDMHLPIDRKKLLSIREAAEYSNIGINKIDKMLKQPNCPFVLFVGSKKLVKRKVFEAYIDGKVAISECLFYELVHTKNVKTY